MSRLRKFLLSLIILLVGVVCVAYPSTADISTYAKVENGAFSFTKKTYNKTTQADSTLKTFSALGTYNLFSSDQNTMKSMYTTKYTDCSSIDIFMGNYNPVFTNSSIVMSANTSSDSSSENPYASHAFKIDSGLLKFAQMGYLDITIRANVKVAHSADRLNMILYNGTLSGISSVNGSSVCSSDVTSTSLVSHSVTINNPQSSDFMVVYCVSGGYENWGTISMTIEKPVLEITTKDKSAPSVSFEPSNNGDWTNGNREVTISISDTQTGIKSVTSKQGLTQVSNDGKNAVYKMTLTENTSVDIVVEDNIGNRKTYTYVENKIDKTVSQNLTITAPELSYVPNIKFSINYESDNKSAETIYYSVDGENPTSESLVAEKGSDIAINLEKGMHTIRAIVVDDCGNITSVVSKTITIDKYTVDIITNQCDYTMATSSGILTTEYYAGENIRFDFLPFDNCVRNVLKVNNEEVDFNGDYYDFTLNQDVKIEVCYAYVITILDFVDVYTFNPNVEEIDIDYSFNVQDDLDYEIMFTKNGNKEKPFNVGTYTLTWSHSSYNFVGRGSFEFVINPMDIYITADSDQSKIYGSEDFDLTYTIDGIPSDEPITVDLDRVDGEHVGTYEILLKSYEVSSNYRVNYESAYFTIYPKKIIVLADAISKIYGDKDPKLTYKLFNSYLVGEDVLHGMLTRVEGENVGEYRISIGTLSNSNYEILFKGNVFAISPRPIDLIIEDKLVTYGESTELTYTLSEKVEDGQIVGTLSRAEGYEVGCYKINLGSIKSENYTINVAKEGVYEIIPKAITVTAINAEKTYGDVDPEFNYEVDGLLGDDSLDGCLIREVGENVGSYQILKGTLNNPNYIIDYTQADLNINPASISIVIDDKSHVYGEIEQDLTCQIIGVKFDDVISLELTRAEGVDAGEYAITCGEMLNANYVVESITNGTYTIDKALLVPSIAKQSFV